MGKTKKSKRWKEVKSKVEQDKFYPLEEAFSLLEKTANTKFKESVDVAFNLGIDPKQSEQQVRGAASLPHGLGKNVRVLVFARGQKAVEAKEGGADFVGEKDLVEKIKERWLGFDRVISTPDMMVLVSKIAKILGPRDLMPNPKLGTVTMDVKKAVEIEKKGKCSFRTDKAGIVHTSIGRISMGKEKLKENFKVLLSTISSLKPSSSKGVYLKSIFLSSTMGPGIPLDLSKSEDINSL